MKLTARRVRRLRRWIASERCPERPGLVHVWEDLGEYPTDLTYSAFVRFWECVKCGKWDQT